MRVFSGDTARETLLDQPHLGAVDPPVLDRQRSGGVDPEHGDLLVLEPGAEIVGNIGLVSVQRRGEAANDIVERNVVIARNGQDLVPGRAQAVEPGRGLPELVDPRALGEIAADDDQIGLLLFQPGLRRRHDLWIVGAEMNVRKMGYAGRHGW